MSKDVTVLLHRWSSGDENAMGDLFPVVCAERCRLARRAMSRERSVKKDWTLAKAWLWRRLKEAS